MLKAREKGFKVMVDPKIIVGGAIGPAGVLPRPPRYLTHYNTGFPAEA